MASTIVQPPVANVAPITDPVYAYQSDNGFFSAEFASTIGTADAVKFSTNGYMFAWKPDNVIYVDSAGNMDVIFGVNAGASAQVYKNRVSYVGTSQLTTDIFDCNANELKHTIQMVAPPRIPASYVGTPTQMASGGTISYDSTLDVWANGVKQTTDFEATGDIGFQDADGKLVYKLPMITVEDADGNTTTGTYKVTFNADGTISFYGMVPWAWLQTAVYPVVIDPTVVGSTGYYVQCASSVGGNGRNMVVDGSGNIYTSVDNGNANGGHAYVYKSADGGTTWSLVYTANIASGTNHITSHDMTIDSNGYIYLFVSESGGIVTCYYSANAGVGWNSVVILAAQTYASSGVCTTSDNVGNVYLAYENNTQNKYAIIKSGSTIVASGNIGTSFQTSNGGKGITIEYLTQGYALVVICAGGSGTNWYTAKITATTTGTVTLNSLGTGGTSFQAASITQDSVGTVWMWAVNSGNQLAYLTSTDGGTTWSSTTLVAINTTTTYAIKTGFFNGNIYVFWYANNAGGFADLYYMYGPTNSNWTNITKTDIQPGTQNVSGNTGMSVCWRNYNLNTNNKIYVASDDGSNGVYSQVFVLNNPPNAPTLTAHANFDATVAQTLAWTFSDPDTGNTQSSYQLQIVDTSNSSVVIDTGKVASTTNSYSLAANALSNAKNYQWRVQTWDNSGAQGPYSAYSTFSTAAAPTVTLTTPTSGATVSISSLTAQFSYSDPASNAQQSYQVQLLDSADGTVLSDSGTINGTNNQYTIQYALANSTTYHVKARATNSQGITSAWADNSFSTSFTTPATPTIAVTPSNANANIQIAITNPAPIGSQPAVSYNDVYRRNTGTTTWTRIATNVANNGTYTDYATASGQGYDYKATSYGNNGTQIDSNIVTNQSISLTYTGLWLHDVNNPSGTVMNLQYYNASNQSADGSVPLNRTWTPSATSMQFAGRNRPVIEFGEQDTFELAYQYVTMLLEDGQWPILEALIRVNKSTLCFRDGRGTCIFGCVMGYKATDLIFGYMVDLTLEQTSYSISV